MLLAGVKWAWPHCRRVALHLLQDGGDQPPPPAAVMVRADPDSSSSSTLSQGSDRQPPARMRVVGHHPIRVRWEPNQISGADQEASTRGRRKYPATPGPNEATPTHSTPRSSSSPPGSRRSVGVQVDIEDDAQRGAAGGQRSGAGGGQPLDRGRRLVVRPGHVRPPGLDVTQPPPSLGLYSSALTPIHRSSARFSTSRAARTPDPGDVKPEPLSDEEDDVPKQ